MNVILPEAILIFCKNFNNITVFMQLNFLAAVSGQSHIKFRAFAAYLQFALQQAFLEVKNLCKSKLMKYLMYIGGTRVCRSPILFEVFKRVVRKSKEDKMAMH